MGPEKLQGEKHTLAESLGESTGQGALVSKDHNSMALAECAMAALPSTTSTPASTPKSVLSAAAYSSRLPQSGLKSPPSKCKQSPQPAGSSPTVSRSQKRMLSPPSTKQHFPTQLNSPSPTSPAQRAQKWSAHKVPPLTSKTLSPPAVRQQPTNQSEARLASALSPPTERASQKALSVMRGSATRQMVATATSSRESTLRTPGAPSELAETTRSVLSPPRGLHKGRLLSPPAPSTRVTSPEDKRKGFGATRQVPKQATPSRTNLTSRRFTAPVKTAENAEKAMRRTIEKLQSELAAEREGKQETIKKLQKDAKEACALANEAITMLEHATSATERQEQELVEKLGRSKAAAGEVVKLTDASTATDNPYHHEEVSQALEKARAEKEELQDKLVTMQELVVAQEKETTSMKQAASDFAEEKVELKHQASLAQSDARHKRAAAQSIELYRDDNKSLLKQITTLHQDLTSAAEAALTDKLAALKAQQLTHSAAMHDQFAQEARLKDDLADKRARLQSMQALIDTLQQDVRRFREGTASERKVGNDMKMHKLEGELMETTRQLTLTKTQLAEALRMAEKNQAGPSNNRLPSDIGSCLLTEDAEPNESA